MTMNTAPQTEPVLPDPGPMDPATGKPALGQTDLRAVKLMYSGPGKALVEIDGVDLTNRIHGFRVEAQAPDPQAYVVLDVLPRMDGVEFEGLARVAVGEQPDPGPAAAKFLAAIDAGELERVALMRDDVDSDGGLTGAMLRQLQEWASGRA